MFEPDLIYFITSRTIDGSFFLRPSPVLNNVIGAVLADAQRVHRVEIFDYVFLSNHMHLAVRSRDGQIPAFMQYLKANIATTVNRILDRQGHFWECRYAATPILDVGGQIERATYIYGHGVKEGLVMRAAAWPGLASVKERLTGRTEVYQRLDRAQLCRARCNRKAPQSPAKFTRQVHVELSPWPFLAAASASARRRRVVALVSEAESRGRAKRGCRRPIGVRAVLAQDPRDRPRTRLERKPLPLCHAHDPEQRQCFRERYTGFLEEYRQASRRFRRGDVTVLFPRYSFRPPLPLGWSASGARAGPPTKAPPAH